MRIVEWRQFAGESPPESARIRDALPENRGFSLTIGVFDGVHRGHQELIRRIVSRSPCSTVITFTRNPKQVLSPGTYHGDIFSLKQKLAIFDSLGISRTVLIDFSGNFSKLTGREFIYLLKKRFRIEYVALGMNFRCGYRLDTGAAAIKSWMKEDGIITDLVHPVMEGRHPVSSSRIRAAISSGDLSAAAVLLGRKIRIDLSDIPPCAAGEDRSYDAASAFRILPPEGRYTALVHGADTGEGIKTGISIRDGKILIPGKTGRKALNAESVELIQGD
ncbi:MAG: FAD synthetase family protein [Treponema sp.]|jgi:riboflavin kinase/FMN adenylyltransferase|nr:FAD synthetase family protein [Treponema sp.]